MVAFRWFFDKVLIEDLSDRRGDIAFRRNLAAGVGAMRHFLLGASMLIASTAGAFALPATTCASTSTDLSTGGTYVSSTAATPDGGILANSGSNSTTDKADSSGHVNFCIGNATNIDNNITFTLQDLSSHLVTALGTTIYYAVSITGPSGTLAPTLASSATGTETFMFDAIGGTTYSMSITNELLAALPGNFQPSGANIPVPTNYYSPGLNSSKVDQFTLGYGVNSQITVPEPSTIAIFAASLVGLATFRRRRSV
jgi:hypothetical protein